MSAQLATNTSATPSRTTHRLLAAFVVVFGAALLWSWIHASRADASPSTSVIAQPTAPLPVAVTPVAVPPTLALPLTAPSPDSTLPDDVADGPVGAPAGPGAPQLGPAAPELGPVPDGAFVVDPPEAPTALLALPPAPSAVQPPSGVVHLASLSTPTPPIVVAVSLSEGGAASTEPRPTAPIQRLSPVEPVGASLAPGVATNSSAASETEHQRTRVSPLSWVAAANTSRRDFRRPADDALPAPLRDRPQNQRLPGSAAGLRAVGDIGAGGMAIILATLVMPAPAFGERSPPSRARRRAPGFLQPLERPG